MEWISVKDRLPGPRGGYQSIRCFVLRTAPPKTVARYKHLMNQAKITYYHGCVLNDGWDISGVHHWMPIEPPNSNTKEVCDSTQTIYSNNICDYCFNVNCPGLESCDPGSVAFGGRKLFTCPNGAYNTDRDSISEKYNELLMAVEDKFDGETRHETALKYIRFAQTIRTAGSSETKPVS